MPIYKDGNTIHVTDEGGNILKSYVGGAMYKTPLGELIPADKDGNIIDDIGLKSPTINNPAISTAPVKGAEQIAQEGAEKPEDNSGLFKSFYNARLRPIIDGASDAFQRGDLGANQAKLMAEGIKSTLKTFRDSFPDASLRHGVPKTSFEENINSIPIAGPMAQRMREQIDAGDYSGAIGTLGGTISPGLEPHLVPQGISKLKELGNKVPEAIAEKTLPKLFPRSAQVLPEDVAAQVTSDIPSSIGQLTQNANAQRLEGSHGGAVATELADSQRALQASKLKDLQSQYFPNGVPQNINGFTQGKLVENFFDAKDKVKAKFDDFRDNYANKNVIPVTSEEPNPNYIPPTNAQQFAQQKAQGIGPTIKTQQDVRGPIMLTESAQLADEIKGKLDKYRTGSDFEQLPQRSKDKFNELNSLVNNLSKRTSTVVNGQTVQMPIQTWEKLKQINTDIGLSKSELSNFSLAQSQVVGLSQALKRDIQSSIEGHWGSGKATYQKLEDANASHGAFKDLFDEPLKGKLFKGNENLSRNGANLTDPTNLYAHVSESPVIAKQFMDALGPTNRNVAKGAIIGQLSEIANNPATGDFSPDAMINKLNSPGYKEIFSSAERASAENLLRQLRGSNPSDLVSKGAGISNKAFHMAFPLVGLAGGIATGHMGVGLLSGVGVEMGLSTFAKKIMLNPKYARIAAQLPYQSATSSSARILSKSLMQALKGSSISVIMKDGSKQSAIVDDKGEIQLAQGAK